MSGMGEDLGAMVLRLSLEVQQFKAGLRDAAANTQAGGDQMSEAMKKAERDATRLDKTLEDLKNQAGKTGAGLREAADGAGKLDHDMTATIAKGNLVANMLGNIAQKATEAAISFYKLGVAAGDYQDLADMTGASAAGLASMRTAADVAGVSVEALAKGANALSVRLAKVDDDSKGAGLALKAIGLEVGKIKDMAPEEQYRAIAQAMGGYADGANKVAVAQALWGANGAKNLKVMKELADESEASIKLTDGQIAMADNFADAQNKSASQMKQLAQVAAVQLIPQVGAVTQVLGGAVKELVLVGTQSDEVGKNTGVQTFAEGAVSAMMTVIEAVLILGANLKYVFGSLGDFAGAYGAVAMHLLKGDVAGARAIGQAYREESERGAADLAKTEAKIFGLRTKIEELAKKTRDAANAPPAPDDKPAIAYNTAKHKAGAVDNSAADAEIAALKALATQKAEIAKQEMDTLNSEFKRGLMFEEDYLAQQLKLNLKALEDKKDVVQAEIAAAEKKKKSMKEVAALTGQLALIDEQMNTARIKHSNAYLDMIAKEEAAVRALVVKNDAAADKSLDLGQKSLDQLVASNEQLALQNEAIGLTTEQTNALTMARMNTAIATAQLNLVDAQNIEGNEARVAQIEREIVLLEQRRQLLAEGQFKTEVAEADKAAKGAAQNMSQQIYQGLSNSLYRGFEAGKGFAASFLDGLKNTFKSTILQVGVQGVMALGASALGMGGTAANAAGFGGGSNPLTTLSNASSAYSAAGAGSQFLFGGSAGASSQSLVYANAVQKFGGDGIGALAQGNGGWAGVEAGGAGSGGVSSLAAAAPYIAAFAIAYELITSSEEGMDGYRNGGSYNLDKDGKAQLVNGKTLGTTAASSYTSGSDGNLGQVVDVAAAATPLGGQLANDKVLELTNLAVQTITETLKGFGSLAKLTDVATGLASSNNMDALVYAGGKIDGKAFGSTLEKPALSGDNLTDDAALKTYAAELSRSVIGALQVADLGGQVGKYVTDLGDVKALTGDAAATALEMIGNYREFTAAFKDLPFDYLKDISVEAAAQLAKTTGGIPNLVNGLGTLYEAFYSPAEKAANLATATSKGFEKLGTVMPEVSEGTRAWYRSEVERLGAMDLSVEANARAYAGTLALAGAVDQLAKANEADLQTRAEWQDKLDVLTGKSTERQQQMQKDLAGATSDTTRALIEQTYAQEDSAAILKNAADWQKRLDLALGRSTDRQQQEQQDLADTTDLATQALIKQVYAQEEAQGLQEELDRLTLTSEQLRAKERQGIKDSNKALFDLITARTAEKAATDYYTQQMAGTVSGIAAVLKDGFLGTIVQDDVGGRMATVITNGLLDTLTNNVTGQIAQGFTDAIITPLMTQIFTTGAINTAFMKGSIEEVVKSATTAATNISTLLNDPGFKSAVDQIIEAAKALGAAFQQGAGSGGAGGSGSSAGGGGDDGFVIGGTTRKTGTTATGSTGGALSYTGSASGTNPNTTASQRFTADRQALEVRLLQAQGKALEAAAKQRAIDTAGLAAWVVAMYDANTALEQQIADTNTKLAWQRREDVLTGKRTAEQIQLEDDLAGVVDAATRALITHVHQLEDATKAQEALTEALKTHQDDARAATDKAFATLQRSVDAQRTTWQAAQQAAEEAANAAQAVFDTLKDQVTEIRGEVASTTQMQAAQGRAFIEQALATAQKTGYLPDDKALQDAIAGVRQGITETAYKSQAEADLARLELASDLSGLQGLAGHQLTEAQQQLKAAKDELEKLDKVIADGQALIDATRGVDTSVMTVAAAIDNLAKALLKEQEATAAVTANAAGGSSTMTGTQLAAMQTDLLKRNSADFASINFKSGVTDALQASLQAGSSYPNIFVTAEAALRTLNGVAASALTMAGQANKALLDPNATISMADRQAYGLGQISAAKLLENAGIQSFDVGTDYVPYDMYAKVHKGERITPRAFNPTGAERAAMRRDDVRPVVVQVAAPASSQASESGAREVVAVLNQIASDSRVHAITGMAHLIEIKKTLRGWEVVGLPPTRTVTPVTA